jgi:hypothetical protein
MRYAEEEPMRDNLGRSGDELLDAVCAALGAVVQELRAVVAAPRPFEEVERASHEWVNRVASAYAPPLMHAFGGPDASGPLASDFHTVEPLNLIAAVNPIGFKAGRSARLRADYATQPAASPPPSAPPGWRRSPTSIAA